MHTPHDLSPTSARIAPTDRCPLCGGPNGCAMAAGLPPERCWCMQAPLDPAALARIPATDRGLRCVCAACGQARPAAAA
ncbi:MAG: cysteine-rich CWC family protein [Burkholderiaceae bacterium]